MADLIHAERQDKLGPTPLCGAAMGYLAPRQAKDQITCPACQSYLDPSLPRVPTPSVAQEIAPYLRS